MIKIRYGLLQWFLQVNISHKRIEACLQSRTINGSSPTVMEGSDVRYTRSRG